MIFKEVKGDLFAIDTNKWVLAHCISSDVKADKKMNKGIAKLFREKFPEMARQISPNLQLGTAIRYQLADNIIYNLVPKEKVWQKAKDEYKKSYYSQLEQSLVSLREQMIKYNEKFLAMPRISSGLDEGNWDEIQEIIKKVFKNTDIEIQIRNIADSIQIGNIRYTLENAKSDRSRCRTCKHYIKKDSLRIVESIPMGRYISKSNYCKKCGMLYIKGIKNSAEELLKLILKDDFDI